MDPAEPPDPGQRPCCGGHRRAQVPIQETLARLLLGVRSAPPLQTAPAQGHTPSLGAKLEGCGRAKGSSLPETGLFQLGTPWGGRSSPARLLSLALPKSASPLPCTGVDPRSGWIQDTQVPHSMYPGPQIPVQEAQASFQHLPGTQPLSVPLRAGRMELRLQNPSDRRDGTGCGPLAGSFSHGTPRRQEFCEFGIKGCVEGYIWSS